MDSPPASGSASGSVPSQQKPPPKPFALIRFSRDPHFVNRGDILDQIASRLNRPNTHCRVALVGLGGAGKSQLAIEYAHRVATADPDHPKWVFWIYAAERSGVLDGFRAIADAVDLPGRQESGANIARLVHTWLSNPHNGQWVMILDIVDDYKFFYGSPENGEVSGSDNAESGPSEGGRAESGPLINYLPQSHNGSILITTRDEGVARGLVDHDDENIIRVDQMTEREALELLRNKLSRGFERELHRDPAAAADLVRALDYVPLAISQAAAYIKSRKGRCSIKDYLKEFRRAAHKFLERNERDSRRDGAASNAVFITWQKSFRHIRAQRASAADLLSLMSSFAPQGIPEWVLKHSDVDPQSSVYDPKEFDGDILMLQDYCLVTPHGSDDLFKMHSLVQLSTRRWLGVSGKHDAFQTEFIKRLSSSFPIKPRNLDIQTFKTCRSLFPHVQAASEMQPSGTTACLDMMPLLSAASSMMIVVGKKRDAERLFHRAVSLLEVSGVTDEKALDMVQELRENLAELYSTQGRLEEAEKQLVLALEHMKSRQKSDHPAAFEIMARLSSLYLRQGQVDRAQQFFWMSQDGLRLLNERGGDLSSSNLRILDTIASTSMMQGQYEEAACLYDVILKLRLSLAPCRSKDELLGNVLRLVECYILCDRVTDAESLARGVLEIQEDMSEYWSFDVYSTLLHHYLAVIHLMMGHVQDAVQEDRQVITGPFCLEL
ncbi:hypothetical protein VTJ04DRAFT_2755 [Mycothermus thermophilus]|uniref:uncharacterized protein n=1 Tax=Humicola insolens TaxID=85995 RepID=UPI0037433A35